MGLKVLVVDDDPQLRTLVSRFLGTKGFEVVTAENGELGAQAAIDERPGLIIMDLNMPVMNGFEATRKVKAQPETKAIPVIVLTAEDAMSNYDAIYEAGADAYVAKPVDFEQLLGRVLEYS